MEQGSYIACHLDFDLLICLGSVSGNNVTFLLLLLSEFTVPFFFGKQCVTFFGEIWGNNVFKAVNGVKICRFLYIYFF